MKKYLFLAGILLLCGCSFNSFEVKETSKTARQNERRAVSSDIVELIDKTFNGSTRKEYFKVTNPKDKYLYMIKYNSSDTDYPWFNTGFIENSETRNASTAYLQSQNTRKEKFSYIRKRNQEAHKLLTKDTSRSSKKSLKIKKNDASVGDTKKMYFTIEGKGDVKRKATCKYVGEKCVIWFVDNANIPLDFSSSDFKKLGKKFDSICEIEEEYFGGHTYTESDYKNIINSINKIDIVLVDINEDSSYDQGGFICGYVYDGDLIKDSVGGNETQAIYLDSYLYKLNPQTIYSTIVHEYCHLLNFVQKTVINGKDMNIWYTEMLAMLAEDMFQDIIGTDNSDGRLDQFILYHSAGFGNWRDDSISYSNAFAFGSYLARNFGGPELIAEIAKNKYTDEKSITKALKKFYPDEDIDFNYVLQREPLVLLKDSGYTLDKKVRSKKDDKVCFKKLDAFKEITCDKLDKKDWIDFFSTKFIDKYGKGDKIISTKKIVKLSGDMDDQFALGKYGFSVRRLSKELKSFTVVSFDKEGIEYYFTY